MVNLPNGQPSRGISRMQPRSHHNWGFRFNRNREAERAEPVGLLRLEELTRRAVYRMQNRGERMDGQFIIAMDLLRLQYNLNFMVLCENCGGLHDHDELLAPER